ncbi:MAG: phosphocholine cytidylyltransferase family protein [Selenomonadaceae bacterium]|nr:phosphocholine cytidylyltransferase family protein [Selenomonadaceae bacterium]
MTNCKVQRAIILAAGLGSRMAPVTDTLPKPLVPVHGKPLMERLLDAVLAAGIEEIYLVRGYLGEQFEKLLPKYPMLRFIENPDYQSANNISSVVYAGELLGNAYLIEGDLLLKKPELIAPCQQESNYLAIPVDETDDWCFYPDEEGYIRKMAVGGKDCMQMVGISYWTEADGKRLAERARSLYYDQGRRDIFWDEIALDAYLTEFRVRVRICGREDVIELDTLEELRALDASYCNR